LGADTVGSTGNPGLPTIASEAKLGAQDAAGYYRVLRQVDSSGSSAPSATVFWMPAGSAGSAPAAIKALPNYREAMRQGLLAQSNATFYGPDAFSTENAVNAAAMEPCGTNWLCLYKDSPPCCVAHRFSSNYWQHLSNYY
jgi:hypothetical protein